MGVAANPPKTKREPEMNVGDDAVSDKVGDDVALPERSPVRRTGVETRDSTARSAAVSDVTVTELNVATVDPDVEGAVDTGTSSTRTTSTRRQRTEARKVRRLIRHVDPWSVLKASLLFFLSLWFIFMIAAAIVWTVGRGSGTIDKVETFVQSNLGQPDFRFDGNFLFRQVGLIGLVLTLAWTLAATIASVVFNLISDIIGGIWITVIEEESIRVRRD